MRILYLSVAAVALSGCSWVGLGGQSSNSNYGYNNAPASCAGDCLARWNVEGAIGTAYLAGGSAITGKDVDPANGGIVDNISMRGAYQTGLRAELGGSYALNVNRKVTATGFYQNHKSEGDLQIGNVNGQNFTGSLTDYTTYGAELGLRQYFAPKISSNRFIGQYRPYVEGKLGAAYVEDIALTNPRTNGTPFAGGTDIPFYEGGWVPTASGMIGVEAPLTRFTTIGVETGLRYTGHPKSDTTVLNGTHPISGSNNDGGSWSVPLMVRGRYRF